MSEISSETIEAIRCTLDGVDLALVRLRESTYRRCISCSEELDTDQLIAYPLTIHCAAHLEVE